MDDLRMLKTSEVAERYRITGTTVQRWVDAGDFPPPLRIGSCWYWLEADLHLFDLYTRYLASCALAGEEPDEGDKPVYSTTDLEANVAAYRKPERWPTVPPKSPEELATDREFYAKGKRIMERASAANKKNTAGAQ